MSKIAKLELAVRELYEKKDPNRDPWADWLWKKHVLVVADNAERLAKRFDAPVDQSRAAALLHDIADSVMWREDPTHENKSLKMARKIMAEAGFDSSVTDVVVNDALALHGCKDGKKPTSLVGKVLSTADALAHLNTKFYDYAAANSPERTSGWIKEWASEKLPRDYNDKIAFDSVREENKERYEELLTKYT